VASVAVAGGRGYQAKAGLACSCRHAGGRPRSKRRLSNGAGQQRRTVSDKEAQRWTWRKLRQLLNRSETTVARSRAKKLLANGEWSFLEKNNGASRTPLQPAESGLQWHDHLKWGRSGRYLCQNRAESSAAATDTTRKSIFQCDGCVNDMAGRKHEAWLT
jgi:hypothetical protein